jgi:hypothetical protein
LISIQALPSTLTNPSETGFFGLYPNSSIRNNDHSRLDLTIQLKQAAIQPEQRAIRTEQCTARTRQRTTPALHGLDGLQR